MPILRFCLRDPEIIDQHFCRGLITPALLPKPHLRHESSLRTVFTKNCSFVHVTWDFKWNGGQDDRTDTANLLLTYNIIAWLFFNWWELQMVTYLFIHVKERQLCPYTSVVQWRTLLSTRMLMNTYRMFVNNIKHSCSQSLWKWKRCIWIFDYSRLFPAWEGLTPLSSFEFFIWRNPWRTPCLSAEEGSAGSGGLCV